MAQSTSDYLLLHSVTAVVWTGSVDVLVIHQTAAVFTSVVKYSFCAFVFAVFTEPYVSRVIPSALSIPWLGSRMVSMQKGLGSNRSRDAVG